MATVVNDRDIALQNTSPRLIATSVAISGTAASFLKQKNGGGITPSSITLTAVTTVFTSPTFAWYYALSTSPSTWVSMGGGSTQNITGSTFVGLIGTGTSIQYKVTATQTGFLDSTNTFIITYSGEADEAIVVSISRSNASAPYDSTGTTPTLVGGYLPNTGTVITAKRGNSDLTYNASSGANTFWVSATSTVGGTITYYSAAVGSGTTYTVDNITAMSAASITVIYTVTCRDASGASISPSFTVQITYTKLLAGAAGSGYIHAINPAIGYIGIDTLGNAVDFSNAKTDYSVIFGATDDTTNWTYTKTDYNCTSTLTTSHLQVNTYGGASSSITYNPSTAGSGVLFPSLAANEQYGNVCYGKGIYLVTKYKNVSPYTVTKIAVSTDNGTSWADATIPTMDVGGHQAVVSCAYGSSMDKFVLLGGWGSSYATNTTAYSTNGTTWSTGGTLPTSSDWFGVVYGGGKFIAYKYAGSSAFAYSTNGTSWSTGSFGSFSPAGPSLAYGNGIWICSSLNNGYGTFKSLDGGSTWSQSLAYSSINIGYLHFVGGIFIMQVSPSLLKISIDGGTWTSVTTSGFTGNDNFIYFNGIIYAIVSTNIYYSKDLGRTWTATTSRPTSSGYVYNLSGDITSGKTSFVLPFTTSAGGVHEESHNATPNFPTDNTCYVDITAAKSGQTSVTKRFLITKGTPGTDVITSYAQPGAWVAPATSDGIVTSYSGGVITCRVLKNGIDDSANWSFAFVSDTGITPASGSTNVVTVTALTQAFTTGNITVTATKAGQFSQVFIIPISKSLGSVTGGPVIGSTFNAMTTAASGTAFIGLRFKTDGSFQLAHVSGTWVAAGQWAGAIQAGIGSSYYLKVTTTGSALTSGTTGTWTLMSSDQDYTLSQTGTGVKSTVLTVYFGTTSTGGSVVQGSGTLQVEVA